MSYSSYAYFNISRKCCAIKKDTDLRVREVQSRTNYCWLWGRGGMTGDGVEGFSNGRILEKVGGKTPWAKALVKDVWENEVSWWTLNPKQDLVPFPLGTSFEYSMMRYCYSRLKRENWGLKKSKNLLKSKVYPFSLYPAASYSWSLNTGLNRGVLSHTKFFPISNCKCISSSLWFS